MFQCTLCKKIFDETEIVHRFSRTDGWSHECPFCGSDDFFEIEQCNECGEWTDADELSDGGLCPTCKKSAIRRLSSLIITNFSYHEVQLLREYVDPEVLE